MLILHHKLIHETLYIAGYVGLIRCQIHHIYVDRTSCHCLILKLHENLIDLSLRDKKKIKPFNFDPFRVIQWMEEEEVEELASEFLILCVFIR